MHALGEAPFQWIVNSNALGVAFLARENEFRISFLSRHATDRLADGSLLGLTPDELIDQPASILADVAELRSESLRNPANYPATVVADINDRHMELAISSVMSSENEYLGVMMTFKDSTDVVRRQNESTEFKDRISGYAMTARAEADRTEEVAGGLGDAVATVSGNGATISKLIGELSNLNNQTRMLSLNASIESVRAGEAGRAFRVIADEVGELALRTQAVADEVESILKTIDVDSTIANECATELVKNVAALISTQREMDREIQDQG